MDRVRFLNRNRLNWLWAYSFVGLTVASLAGVTVLPGCGTGTVLTTRADARAACPMLSDILFNVAVEEYEHFERQGDTYEDCVNTSLATAQTAEFLDCFLALCNHVFR